MVQCWLVIHQNLDSKMNINGWKAVLERIRRSEDDCIEFGLLAEYLEDVDSARTTLQQRGYGHSGMKMSELAELVVPF